MVTMNEISQIEYWFVGADKARMEYLLLVIIPAVLEGRKEGNILFNNALNTFYLCLYYIGHMVRDHSERKATATTTWATLSD